MSKTIPKYKCEAIAHDVTKLLNLSPGLHWTAVRDYASPQLIPDPSVRHFRYDDVTRALIKRALDRELRYLHAR